MKFSYCSSFTLNLFEFFKFFVILLSFANVSYSVPNIFGYSIQICSYITFVSWFVHRFLFCTVSILVSNWIGSNYWQHSYVAVLRKFNYGFIFVLFFNFHTNSNDMIFLKRSYVVFILNSIYFPITIAISLLGINILNGYRAFHAVVDESMKITFNWI